MKYRDRVDAGQRLASHLGTYRGRSDAIVLGLPRGGVPVAFEVARALDQPLDVFVVRKLGVPWQPELAMGAIASGGVRVLNDGVVADLVISKQEIDAVVEAERRELERRERAYRDALPPLDVRGKTVILVDDGIATGSTIRAAILALKRLGAARLVVAVPVAPAATVRRLEGEVDEVVCPMTPFDFWAIGQFYDDFSQTSDDAVRELLAEASSSAAERLSDSAASS